jgi:hypothetical protein
MIAVIVTAYVRRTRKPYDFSPSLYGHPVYLGAEAHDLIRSDGSVEGRQPGYVDPCSPSDEARQIAGARLPRR